MLMGTHMLQACMGTAALERSDSSRGPREFRAPTPPTSLSPAHRRPATRSAHGTQVGFADCQLQHLHHSSHTGAGGAELPRTGATRVWPGGPLFLQTTPLDRPAPALVAVRPPVQGRLWWVIATSDCCHAFRLLSGKPRCVRPGWRTFTLTGPTQFRRRPQQPRTNPGSPAAVAPAVLNASSCAPLPGLPPGLCWSLSSTQVFLPGHPAAAFSRG